MTFIVNSNNNNDINKTMFLTSSIQLNVKLAAKVSVAIFVIGPNKIKHTKLRILR